MPVCTCEACEAWTYKDVDGSRKPGRLVDASVAKGHRYAAAMKRKLERRCARSKRTKEAEDSTDDGEEDGEEVEHASVRNTVFLETLAGQKAQELPVRGRDRDTSTVETKNVSKKSKKKVSTHPNWSTSCHIIPAQKRQAPSSEFNEGSSEGAEAGATGASLGASPEVDSPEHVSLRTSFSVRHH